MSRRLLWFKMWIDLEVAGSRTINLVDEFLSDKESGRIFYTEDDDLLYD